MALDTKYAAAAAAAATDLLRLAADEHAPSALASSFGAEDMVLIDLIAKASLPIGVFTLDTGRLPDETHALIDRVREVYGIAVDVYFPATAAVESFVHAHGANAFYGSQPLRERCCAIRKTEPPLARALAGKRHGSRGCGGASRLRGARWRWPNSTQGTASRNSILSPSGRATMSGRT
jgi:phosphoadenosine phosphosulfate reductase